MNEPQSKDNLTDADIQQPTEQPNGLTDLEPNADVKGGTGGRIDRAIVQFEWDFQRG